MPQRLTQLAKAFLIVQKSKHKPCKRKNLRNKESGLFTPGFLLEKSERERFLISSKNLKQRVEVPRCCWLASRPRGSQMPFPPTPSLGAGRSQKLRGQQWY